MVDDDIVFPQGVSRWACRRHALDRFEIVLARGVEDAIYALRRSRRLAGFLVDWRPGRSDSAEPLLALIRKLYPSLATPLYVPARAALDAGVVRRAHRYRAQVIPKERGGHWRLVSEHFDESRARVLETERRLREQAAPETLVPRELLVAQAIADCADERSIAEALDVSPSWIRAVDHEASTKLGVSRLAELSARSFCA